MRARCVVATAVLFAAALVNRAAADGYAPTALTAVQILAKARAASGHLQSGQYLIVERDVTPSEMTTMMTQRNGDDYITTVTENDRTSAYGSYRGQRWERDANGIVIRESGFYGKEDPNALAWKHPDDPQYRVRVLGLTQAAPQEYVVEANPPGGQDEYRYYNAQTLLLDKDVVFGVDRYRHETDYSQYRTVFGETIPFHTHYSDGRPANDEEDEITSFTASASSNALVIPEPQPIFGFLTAPVTIPASFSGSIVIPVKIGNETLSFALDTGSTDLFIDAGAASRLGLAEYGKSQGTIGGTFTTTETTVPQLSVGSLTAHNLVFTVGPLNGFEGISGLLGCDFLASAVVGIDFKNSTVTFYPWATFNPVTLGLMAMPIQLDDCVPRVPASIEKVPGHFLLDTGSYATVVYRHYLAKLPRATVASEGETPDTMYGANETSTAIGGDVRSTFYDVTDVVFGGLGYRAGQVLVPNSTSTLQDPDYDGILGRNILKEYVLYLDYNDGVIFIKPNL
jgi:hypothetical protein